MKRVTSDKKLPQSETTSGENPKTYYNYILASDNGVAKFFQPDGSSTISAGKAYFSSTTYYSSTESRGIEINFESGTTSINQKAALQAEDGKWYNLQGIEVALPTKGIYIRNGKKVVIK